MDQLVEVSRPDGYLCLRVHRLFSTLYQLSHQHPILVDGAKKLLAKDNPLPAALEGISKDIKLLSPILSVGLLTWAAEKFPKTTAADRKIRYFLQQLGSIPGAASLTIHKMKRYDLNLDPDECIGGLTEKMKGLTAQGFEDRFDRHPNHYFGHTVKSAKISRNEVDLKELVQGCLEKITDRADNENITITSKIPADIPFLKVDQSKISLAIDGLLCNALEFKPSGGEVTVEVGAPGRGDNRFAIKDNGVGMSSYKVKAITDAQLETLHAAWRQIGEYQNANLLQVRSVVEGQGGTFQLATRQWEGTEVTIELPTELACPMPAVSDSEAPLQGALGTVAA